MKSWGKKTSQTSQVKISAEGIEKALIAGGEDYDRREFDREVIIFMHIIDSILYTDRPPKEYERRPIERLFEIIDSRTYQAMMKRAKKNLATDGEPSDFFRDLYRRFLKWQTNPNRKNNPSAQKNYGAKSMNERWELGEYKREHWMKKSTED